MSHPHGGWIWLRLEVGRFLGMEDIDCFWGPRAEEIDLALIRGWDSFDNPERYTDDT